MKKLQKMLNLTLQEWNWVLYDIGNSAFILLVTAIVPIYFGSLTSAAGLTEDQRFAYWGYGLSIATIVVVLLWLYMTGQVLIMGAEYNGSRLAYRENKTIHPPEGEEETK